MTPMQPKTLPGVTTEPVTFWTTLDSSLRLLCRGLVCSWCADLRAVTTFTRLPEDAEYEQALRTVCRRLAEEFGVEEAVWREEDVWWIRFSRPVATEVPGEDHPLLDRARRVARRLSAAATRRGKDAA